MIDVNPFVYDSANKLSIEQLLDIYIPDHNYSRFIESTRNVVLLGERGSGKSSTLIFSTAAARMKRMHRNGEVPDLSYVGVYIPANNPLTRKREFELLGSEHAQILSEHYLCLSIVSYLIQSLGALPQVSDLNPKLARERIEYVLGWKLRPRLPFLNALGLYVAKISRELQEETLRPEGDLLSNRPFSFSSTVIPVIEALRELPVLAASHFWLMLDDVHDLNVHQRRAVNTWLSFRDSNNISFKIATAKVGEEDYITESGGSVLEGHDFILIDLERPFQGADSEFSKLATEIVQKRLQLSGRPVSATDFFPVSPEFKEALAAVRESLRASYLLKRPDASKKEISDYLYKYARAEYFRSRSDKANRPPYSGFETIVHLSTGVIRNLLVPCYWMFEMAAGDASTRSSVIDRIDPNVQKNVILDQSDRLWLRLQTELELTVQGCTREQARRVYNLYNQLAKLFEDRLMHHPSEPRALVFTISGLTPDLNDEVQPLLDVARRFQVLYIRRGSAKEAGERETYYVPNRMLWPARGLDPVGQHSRVSLTAISLLAAAEGRPFPTELGNTGSLFDEEV